MAALLCLLLVVVVQAAPYLNRGVVPNTPLVLYWTFLEEESVRVDIEWNRRSFAPIILNRSMMGTDLWLCSKESVTQNYQLTDRWAYDHAEPILDTDSSHDGVGTDDLTSKQVVEREEGMTCSFTRKLKTGDHKDRELVRGVTYQLCSFNSTQPNLHMHNSDLSNLFCFYWPLVDHFDGQLKESSESPHTLMLTHGIVMTVLWGFLIDAAMMSVRYLKTRAGYTKIHGLLMLLLGIGSLVMPLLLLLNRYTIVFYNFSTLKTSSKIHILLGLSLITSLLIQQVGGIIVRYLKENSDLEAHRFLKKLWIHKLGGYFVYGIGKVQVLVGWWVFMNGFSTAMLIVLLWYIVLLVCRLLAEYSYRNGRWLFSKLMVKIGRKQLSASENEPIITRNQLTQKEQLLSGRSSTQQSLIQLVLNNKSREYIRQNYPAYRYVFFKNMLCDLTNFNHPGGASIIQSVIGEQISKYLYGGATVQDNPTESHVHSRYAISHLQSRVISKVDDPVCSIFTNEWQLQHITQLSPNLFKITFQNSEFTIKTNPKQPGYLGKYFLITAENVTRPYTLILSQLDYNINYRNKLLEFYKKKFSGAFEMDKQSTSHEISFIVKRYPTGNVSRSVHFGVTTIEGLYGLGLQLEPGNNIVIVGGTGILPFLDLFDLLLKKAIFIAAALQPSEIPIADTINVFNIDYPSMLPKVKVRLFASFSCTDQFKSYAWLLDLHLISKKLNLELFELNLRIPKQSEQLQPGSTFFSHIDREFCQRNFPINSFEKVYCCGPPEMNVAILQVFKQLRYPPFLYRIM